MPGSAARLLEPNASALAGSKAPTARQLPRGMDTYYPSSETSLFNIGRYQISARNIPEAVNARAVL
jgi:hypothetical protein